MIECFTGSKLLVELLQYPSGGSNIYYLIVDIICLGSTFCVCNVVKVPKSEVFGAH